MEGHITTGITTHRPQRDGWNHLTDTSDPGFFQNWLNLQCHLIDGCQTAVLVYRRLEKRKYKAVARWPDAKFDLNPFSELITQAVAQRSGLITLLKSAMGDNASMYGIAYPMKNQHGVFAVIAVTLLARDKQAVKEVTRQLKWGSAWVEIADSRARKNDQLSLSSSVDLLAKILAEPLFDTAAMRLVNEISLFYQCDLVSLGFIKNRKIKVTHLSNSSQFGKKMNLMRRIEAAMSEAIDQRQTIVTPRPVGMDRSVVSLAHHNLVKYQHHKSLLSLPLYSDDKLVGAITLQRDVKKPFSLRDAKYCEGMMALAIAALEEKRVNNRPLAIKIFDGIKRQLSRPLGESYLGRKLAILIFIGIVIFFSVAKGEYRLSATASLKPLIQQFIVAPYDGFIHEAPVRAGDEVSKGDLIVSLDDGDLQLEKNRWLSQQTKLERQYREEAASQNRANVNIIDAQLAQSRAQLKLAESQLNRSRLLAPFDGLIISGDLSQKLGGAVKQGDTLFTISPVNNYRVDLQIRESRIADIKLGQTGTLYLSALPETSFSFKINKITPVASSEDGATFFTVEAELLMSQSGKLQPGMEGIGKVSIDRRKLWEIWTLELTELVRLWWWSWWG